MQVASANEPMANIPVRHHAYNGAMFVDDKRNSHPVTVDGLERSKHRRARRYCEQVQLATLAGIRISTEHLACPHQLRQSLQAGAEAPSLLEMPHPHLWDERRTAIQQHRHQFNEVDVALADLKTLSADTCGIGNVQVAQERRDPGREFWEARTTAIALERRV